MRKIDKKWKFEIAVTSAIVQHTPIPKGSTTWTSDTFGPMREAVFQEIAKLPVYRPWSELYEMEKDERMKYSELSKLAATMRTAPSIEVFNQACDELRVWALRESYWIWN